MRCKERISNSSLSDINADNNVDNDMDMDIDIDIDIDMDIDMDPKREDYDKNIINTKIMGQNLDQIPELSHKHSIEATDNLINNLQRNPTDINTPISVEKKRSESFNCLQSQSGKDQIYS